MNKKQTVHSPAITSHCFKENVEQNEGVVAIFDMISDTNDRETLFASVLCFVAGGCATRAKIANYGPFSRD